MNDRGETLGQWAADWAQAGAIGGAAALIERARRTIIDAPETDILLLTRALQFCLEVLATPALAGAARASLQGDMDALDRMALPVPARISRRREERDRLRSCLAALEAQDSTLATLRREQGSLTERVETLRTEIAALEAKAHLLEEA